MQNQITFVAPGGVVVGDVEIGADSSVWYNAVLRGDVAPIRIGARTNIQDGAVLHGATGFPVLVGDNVTVGHNAIVHGCTVGSNTLVGMGAIVLNGARIGDDCIIGAGALVTQGTVIPNGSVAFGSPAQVIRPTSDKDRASNRANAAEYVHLAHDALSHSLG